MKKLPFLLAFAILLSSCAQKPARINDKTEKPARAYGEVYISKSASIAPLSDHIENKQIINSSAHGYIITRYVPSEQNVAVIKQMKSEGEALKLLSFTPSNNVLSCRVRHPIYGPNKRSFSNFIETAANMELKESGLVASKRPRIIATLDEFDFGIFRTGKWTIRVTLTAEGKEPLTLKHEHTFQAPLFTGEPCQNVAQAMIPAIQSFLYAMYSNPRFVEFARYTPCTNCEKKPERRYIKRKRITQQNNTGSAP